MIYIVDVWPYERLKSFYSWSYSINYGYYCKTAGYFGQITILEKDVGAK